ncbi:MAG: site-specific DNA-methyltransferase, partial [Anaerolineae bacterium]|nr:site-specific DNA-methyltransferase [Anaerolineae bacterium]
PLQYKAVPVTEYVLVYRKHTDRLIDWNIRAYPDQRAVQESKIDDDYERTNVWRIQPAFDSRHPAIFPVELAERVIRYYSFKGDVVLDPFAGIGTVGKAAVRLGRRFVLIEKERRYADIIVEEAKLWLGKDAANVLTINLPDIDVSDILL